MTKATIKQGVLMRNLKNRQDRLIPEGNGKKYCSVCNELKTLEEFTRDKTGRYGRRSACKVCKKKADLIYQATKRSPEQNRQAVKKYKEKIKNTPLSELRHGLLAVYIDAGCRCDLCKEAYKNHLLRRIERLNQ